jgi:oligopeptide/dipeptide ABC transporter ATP-binding protein
MGSDVTPEGELLRVEGLRVEVSGSSRGNSLRIIDTASLALDHQQAVGIVGESGSGKSMLCRALIGTLARYGASVTAGSIRFSGQELAGASENVWRSVRGREIGYVPQSSLAGLNPVLTVETQLFEAIYADNPEFSRTDAREEAVRLLELVELSNARDLLRKRSHQLSGGMRQRVMIAAALARRPKLLVADEPTTALDVSVQSEILKMLKELQRELRMSLILVSHDVAVVEDVCDRVVVMYAGAVVEAGAIAPVLRDPRHPYTEALLQARVDFDARGRDLPTIPGEPPMVGSWPEGCRFWPRCHLSADECRVGGQPEPRDHLAGRVTACIRSEEMSRDA